MTHSNGLKKAHAFKGAAALMIAALSALLLFTACPNAAGGGGSSIEGVWKAVSVKMVLPAGTEHPASYPISHPDGSKAQLYYCFSEGKAYMAQEVTGNPNPAQNGLFKVFDGTPYTLKNNELTIQGTTLNITIDKNTLTMTDYSPEYGTTVTTFTRVSSPTAAQIKAAKKIGPTTP